MSRPRVLPLLALLLAGCGTTVEAVCDDLGECPQSLGADCRADGEALERSSAEAGCADEFDAYLECVGDASCRWRDECAADRAALEACGGALPP